ncbi:probable palmitoyltransferase ZDHHC24 [Dysidea avara]|uniref:probable palmitoyltransferase ZDHHC24 n=1 Tax=Dysidea avara TaxID=196820 RepID=UPI00332631C5
MRRFLPRTRIDFAAMAITAIFAPISLIHAMFLLAALYPNGASDPEYGWNYISHIILAVFMWTNCLIYFIQVVTIDTSVKSLTLPVILQDGWRYCSICQLNTPLRAHHCIICNVCVIRRDHHCYYSGQCIGLPNHRIFVAGLIYGTLGAIYAVVLSMITIIHVESGFNFYTILTVLFPIFAWVIGFQEVNLLYTLFGSLSFFGGLACVAFLLLQVVQILRGQTFYEYKVSISDYNQGFIKNLQDVLGKNWWFYWILPIIPSKLPGDGSHYLEVKKHLSSSHAGKELKSL